LRENATVADAYVWHTGGGCFGLAVELKDGRFLYGTMAVQSEDGTWFAEACLPDADNPLWGVSVHTSIDTFGSDDSATLHVPLTDDALIALVSGLQQAK